MDEKGLGQRLQAARRAAGFTQQELCQETGLSYSTLAKIERGAIKSPSIFTIQQIAAALNTSVDELISGDAPVGRKKQSKRGITFVYFDINGCLVQFYQRTFGLIAADTGIPSDIVEATYVQYNDAVCKGIMSLDDFNQTLGRSFNVENFDWSNYYLDAITSIAGMAELVEWTSKHYKIGLLSNIMPGLIDSMMQRGLIPKLPYDAIIDSSEVKLIKPDPAIFQVAEQKAGAPPNEILLVDDTKLNVTMAERAGWHSIWFNDYDPADSAQRVREALEFS